ncbi:MAG: diaminopimelate decarboxylase [Candidatus Aenigmarchaeota archaeon]|nr:diaminopimelate decarboxylase [Candidatus Aenigmarchaeota archaeon]
MDKKLPFTKNQAEKIMQDNPTPFYIYDENGIRESARKLTEAFSWSEGFRNFFAVKATPNPHILKIMKEEGFGTDCSSMPELVLSEKIGIVGENIMFTSNDTPREEFRKAVELGAIINLDDITHIRMLKEAAGIPGIICFRYNPGPLKAGNIIIGNPVEAKYGLTREQIFEAYKLMKLEGVRRFGIHTMVVSNMLDEEYLIDTARMLFKLAVEIHEEIGIKFEFINLGGGIGIPHKPGDKPVDMSKLSEGIKDAYEKIIVPAGLHPVKIFMECGRFITGPNGYLVAKIRHVARKYKNFVGLDATMANLMRPALYGAYHHITVLGKKGEAKTLVCDVTGSLCENNDKFAIDRELPQVKEGDTLVIHDVGAHGHAMGFQYNGKLRSAELLMKPDGSIRRIRRPETIDDYFATLDFSGI